MTPDRFERHLHHIQLKRRHAIGSWVVGIDYMKELGAFVSSADEVHMANNPVNDSTKKLLTLIRDGEFRAIRHKLTEIEPESSAHIARWRMGIVGKTQKNSLGNNFFTLNKEFILASYYHEDDESRDKINAEISVDELIEKDIHQFVDFYLTRSKDQLGTEGQSVNLHDLINDTRQDIEYWLSHDS